MSSNTPTYRKRTRPIKTEDAAATPAAPPPDEAVVQQVDQGLDPSSAPSPDEPPVDEEAPYKVGYKKPPLDKRFKKGECPNPKGRPKGVKNMRTLILALANEKVTVRENGKVKRMSKIEIGAKKVFNNLAATGDLKNLEFLLKLDGSSNDNRAENGSNSGSSAEQQKPNTPLLKWFIAQHLPKTGSDGEGA